MLFFVGSITAALQEEQSEPSSLETRKHKVKVPRAVSVLTPQQCRHRAESSLLLSLPSSRGRGDTNSTSLLHAYVLRHM